MQAAVDQSGTPPNDQVNRHSREQLRIPLDQSNQSNRVNVDQSNRVSMEHVSQASQVAIEQSNRVAIEHTARVAIEQSNRLALEQASRIALEQATRASIEQSNRLALESSSRIPTVENGPRVGIVSSANRMPVISQSARVSASGDQSTSSTSSSASKMEHSKSNKPLRSTNKPKYCCDFCMYRTDRKDLYTRHQYIHTDDKPFICYACGKLFNRADHVKKHFFRIHADQLYDPMLTRRHHERPQAFSHQPGSLSLPTMVSLPRIVPKEEPCQGKVKPSKTFECMYCTWKGVDSWCLRRHLNTHIKPYVCSLCDYKGARPDRLIKHTLRIHRKHICLRCGLRFDTQEEKDAHQSPCRLTDESRKCGKCQSVFGTKGDLNTHCIVAHGMQLLSCRDCDFKTALVADFEAHCRQYHAASLINPHDSDCRFQYYSM